MEFVTVGVPCPSLLHFHRSAISHFERYNSASNHILSPSQEEEDEQSCDEDIRNRCEEWVMNQPVFSKDMASWDRSSCRCSFSSRSSEGGIGNMTGAFSCSSHEMNFGCCSPFPALQRNGLESWTTSLPSGANIAHSEDVHCDPEDNSVCRGAAESRPQIAEKQKLGGNV